MSSPVPPAIKGIVPSLPPRTSTVLSPHSSPPPPSAPLHGIVPSLPPRTSAVLPPHSSLPPPAIPHHGIVPSLPPSAPKAEEPKNKNHVSVPVTPVASPASRSSQNLPTTHPIMPGSPPPSSSKHIAPETEAPLLMPIAPAPQKLLQKPPLARQPAKPGVPPSIFTVPAAPPSTKPLPNSPAIHPTIPDSPLSNLPGEFSCTSDVLRALDYLSPKYLNKTFPDLARVAADGIIIFTAYPRGLSSLEPSVKGRKQQGFKQGKQCSSSSG